MPENIKRLSPTSCVRVGGIQIRIGDHTLPELGWERGANDRSVRGVRLEFLFGVARFCRYLQFLQLVQLTTACHSPEIDRDGDLKAIGGQTAWK